MSVFSVNDVRYEKLFSLARKTQKEKVLTFFLSKETTKHQTQNRKKNREKKTGGHFIFARLMQIKKEKRDARDARKSSS